MSAMPGSSDRIDSVGKPMLSRATLSLAAATRGPSWAYSIGRMPSGSRATIIRPQASSMAMFQAPSNRFEIVASSSMGSGSAAPDSSLPMACMITSVSLSRARWFSSLARISARSSR